MPHLTKGSSCVSEPVLDPPLSSTASQVPLPLQGLRTGYSKVVAVPRHSSGAIVAWRHDSPAVKVAVGDAAVHTSWVTVARLFVNPHTDTVQLTLLQRGPRTYVDGQRLMRIGSPVEVRATQRISFGNDPTSYMVTPAPRSLVPGRTVACTPRPLTAPAYPSVVSQYGHVSSSCTPRSCRFSLSPDGSSTPLCADKEGERSVASAISMSPEALTLRVQPTNMESRQGSTPCEAAAVSPLLASQRASRMRGCVFTHASCSIAATTSCIAEDANAVRQTTEKCALSAPVTENTETDLLVQCTATVARCSADLVSTNNGAALPSAHLDEEQGGGAACSLWHSLTAGHLNSLPSLCTETAELKQCRHKGIRESFNCESRARSRFHVKPCWTLGPVTSVRSPDWEVVRAMQTGAASPRQNDICQLSSGRVGFKDAIVELRRGHADRRAPSGGRSGHRPPPLRPHLQRSGAARHRLSRHSSSNFSLELTKYTSVNVGGGGKATTTHTTPLSRSEAATDSCSVLSSNLTAAEDAHQRPYMREKLHLCPRVTVIPFIIESFGRTHRYRPLAHLSEPKQAGSSGSSIHSGGDKGAPVDVFDRFAGVPWKHPIAADEMVTPRTEALLRDILRRFPDSTSASDDATFLHCALKRSYDADTDRFSYVDSPALVQLMYKRFLSLLTAIKARMQTAPPVLRLSSPLLCGGDLLGSFADLMVLLSSVAHFSHWSMVHTPLLLLGNYVDVGWHSVEVFMLLCCWAYLQPNKVHLLRGPHEDPAVNGNYRLLRKRCLRYKCRQRFGSRRGITLWAQLNDVFALLPVAAVIDERIFATHGGVPLLRVSTPPSREEGRGTAVKRQRDIMAPVQYLYSATSGSPTRTSSGASTPVSFSCHSADALFSAERWPACAHERGGRYAKESVRPAAARSCSMQQYRSQTPMGETARNALRAECAEGHRGTSARCLSLEPLSGDQANEKDGCPRASAECARARTAVVSSTPLPSWPTSPCDTVPPPQHGMRGQEPEVTVDVGAAVVLPAATTQARMSSLASPSSQAAKAMLSTDGTRSDSETITRTTPACHTPISAMDDTLCGADGGPLVTQRSADARHQACLSSARSERGDIFPLETLEQGCTPPPTAAAESAPGPCSTSSACVSGSEVQGTQEYEAAPRVPSRHTSEDDSVPSEDDFASLLAAMHSGQYAFRTLQNSTQLESQDVARRLRLVRELLWNRPREATAKLLVPEEEPDSDGKNAAGVPWWRPRRVEGCCCRCPADRAHRCCHIFGSGALIQFFLRFHFAMLIRGAPEDPSELYGAELSEEGRLLTLNTCSRRHKVTFQASACLVEPQTLRLATWGSQELADSLGQLSLSSLPGVREAWTARANFEQFVCDTLHTRLRDHHIVGPANQWSVLSAYKTYMQQRAAASTSS